jgi:carbonic anhydrase
MLNIRFSRLSLLAVVAGSCFTFAPSVIADDHGSESHGDEHASKPAENHGDDHGSGGGGEHGGGGGEHGGGDAKPHYPAPPAAKGVSLKVPPATPTAPKAEPVKTPTTPIKPVANIKPVAKGQSKNANTNGNGNAADEAVADVPKNADEALALLREGNQRWMDGNVQNPSTGMLRRKSTAETGQKPFAVVLTCADSRIPVERVFDRGVGEVFVARVAGNVSGPHESGTIEYALAHLNVPVLVVMGHTKCGAVKATVENAHVTPNIASLVEGIKPAVDRARKLNPSLEGAELIEASVRENVWQSVFDLYKSSPTIVEMVQSGKVKVVGAVVDISTGKVEWMGEHPWQEAIVGALAAKNAEPAPGEAPAQPAAAPAPAAHGEKTASAEPKAH